MAVPTEGQLAEIRALQAAVRPLPGQLERLYEIVREEAGELSPESIALLQAAGQKNRTVPLR